MADGTLKIETAVDMDGFVAGGKEVEAAARKMARTVSGIGGAAKVALKKQADSFVRMNQQYAQQQQKVEALKSKLQELENVKVETAEYQKLGNELKDLEEQFEKLETKQREWLSMGFSMDSAPLKELEKELDGVWESMEKVETKKKQMERSGTAWENPKMTDQYQGTESKLAAEQEKLEGMNNRLAISYEALKEKTAGYGGASGKLILKVEAAARKMARTVSGIGGAAKVALKKQAESFVRMNQQYAQQQQKVEALKNKLQELENVKVETAEYQKLGNELKDLEEQFEKLETKQREWLSMGFSMDSAPLKELEKELDGVWESMEKVEAKKKQMEQSGTAWENPKMTDQYQGVESKLAAEQEKLAGMNNRLALSYEALKEKTTGYGGESSKLVRIQQRLQKAAAMVGTAVNKIGTALKKVSSTLKSMVSALKKAISQMLRFGRSANTSQMSLAKMLGTSLLISTAFRVLSGSIVGIREGIQNLAQYSDTTNQSLSSILSSLTKLKNALATAFAPILTVIAPILTQFMDLLSRGATYIGMFFAALTGSNSFVRAKAVHQDYAKSLNKTTQATKNVTKATKDAAKAAEGSLASWDELSVIQFDAAEAMDGITMPETAELTPADMFETVQIESRIKDLVDNIKSYFQNQDWDGLGAFVAGKMNGVVERIKKAIAWENVGPAVTGFVTGFTEFFNTLIDAFDWHNLGETAGEGINTIVKTLNLLIEGIDWKNLGKKFAEGVNGLFDTVNWRELGNLIGNKFMIAWNIFYGFVKKLDWKRVGKSIGQAINGAIEKIDLATIGSGISAFVIGILDMFTEAVRETDWKAVGQEIANLLRSIDWAGIASGLFDAGLALISGLLQAFGELPAPVQVAIAALGAFLAVMAGMSIVSGITSAVAALGAVIGFIATPVGAVIAAIVALIAIGGLLVANWDKICAAAAKMRDWVIGKTKELCDSVTGAFTSLKEKIVNAVQMMRDSIGEKIQAIKDWFVEKTRALRDGAIEAFETLKENVIGAMQVLKESVESKIKAVKEFFAGIVKWVKETFITSWKNAWDSVVETFGKIFGRLAEIAKKPVNGVIDAINWMIDKVEAAQHWIADALSFSIDIPDWAKKLTGKDSFSVSVGKVSLGRLPHLAQGTVVPARTGEFAAILGDNKRETEVVSPLSTIKQALLEAIAEAGMGSGPMTINLNLDGQKVISWLVDQDRSNRNRTGHGIFEGA